MSAHRAPGGRLPLLPLPVHSLSRSRRVQQRQRCAAADIALANSAITSLNAINESLHPSAPLSASSSIAAAAHEPRPNLPQHHQRSSTARRLASRVLASCTRYRRQLSGGACDDAAPSLEPPTVHSAPAGYLPADATPALHIRAARVSLPAAAGTAELLDVLPPALAATYASPDRLLRPLDHAPRSASRVFMCSRPEYIALIVRMRTLGMLHFTTTPRAVNGVFGVDKDGEAMRLIIDARPANAAFIDSPHVSLPSPDLIANFSIPAGEVLYAAKVDLDNFYHRLRMPPAWWPFFALPAVRAGDVGAAGFAADAFVYPCCTTLPMGFSHAVYLAQAAHEHIISTRTSLRAADRVARVNDFGLDRPRHSVYIDDLHMFALGERGREALRLAQDEYVAAMAAVGLPAKPAKVIRPATRGIECLGLMLDGERGDFGLAAPKLQRLVSAARALLAAGACTGRQLARVIGGFTWAALVCRPALAVFSAVYRFIAVVGVRRFELWPSVVRELNAAIGIAPLLRCSLRAPWFDRVVAVDASEAAQGVVAVREPPPVVVVHSPAVRFLPGEPLLADVSSFLGRAQHRWRRIVASPWRGGAEHINVLEARALLTGARWALSHPSAVGSRVLALSDSSVVVGAASKGRSSSHRLLRPLRSLAALLLAAGTSLRLLWVPSASNPADAASRLLPAAPPQ